MSTFVSEKKNFLEREKKREKIVVWSWWQENAETVGKVREGFKMEGFVLDPDREKARGLENDPTVGEYEFC